MNMLSEKINQAIKQTRANSKVKSPLAEELISALSGIDLYRKLSQRVKSGEAILITKLHSFGRSPKKIKVLGFKYCDSDKFVPVVKSKIFKKGTPRSKIVAAFRSAIKPQIKQFREDRKQKIITLMESEDPFKVQEAYKMGFCPLSGKRLLGGKNHVDHIKPFSVLLREFCFEQELELLSVKLNRQGEIKDKKLKEAWEDYHLEHATLQLVNGKANMKKGAKWDPSVQP